MQKQNIPIELTGTIVSPGLAVGSACHYQFGSLEQTAIYNIDPQMIESEIIRLNIAIQKSKEELKGIVKNIKEKIGAKEAKIFETHILILDDRQVINKIIHKIKSELLNTEYAVKSTFEEVEDIFARMDDEYMKDRGTDFSEIKRRVMGHLTGINGRFICDNSCIAGSDYQKIILSAELSPSMIALLESGDISGFITENGGQNSHAAILTRAAGIPYITDIHFSEKIKCGDLIIIDGQNGKISINPEPEVLAEYQKSIDVLKRQKSTRINLGPVIKTKTGLEIELYANIMNLHDIEQLKNYNLAGAGLIRTEFLFYQEKTFPDIEKQIDVYSRLIMEAEGRPLTFRLFDLGGDKKIPSLQFITEENPMLGLRGIRYLLKNQKILTDQITALIAADRQNTVKILYPLITSLQELKQVNQLLHEILAKHKNKSAIPIGMMFEIPAAFLDPAPYLETVDFASIGSNDLTQYLFGVDRNNIHVNHLYNQDSPVIYRLIKQLVDTAQQLGKEVSHCGEIDYQSMFLDNLLEIGIRKFSITPINSVKFYEKIRES